MKTIRELLKDSYSLGFIGDYLELDNEIDAEDFDRDALEEELQEEIYEQEVIYYTNAMDLLSKEDPSLRESIGIASELGMELENLNSETLATLLIQRLMEEELSDFLDMVEKEIDELNSEDKTDVNN